MSTNDAINLLKDAITDQLLIHECTEVVAKRTENPGGTDTLSFAAVGPANAGPFGFAFVCANSHPFPAATTAAYVDAVRGTRARILDTRKTIPGLRLAQKYAVRVGGGVNHRIGLFDAVMLKENHVRALGSVAAAIARARALHPALPLIVEVETLDELREALDTGCTRVLIDDFDAGARREAVRIAKGAPYHGRIPLEVSGGVDMTTLRGIAEDGVDYISIGGLTKHVHAIDLSMKLGPPPSTAA